MAKLLVESVTVLSKLTGWSRFPRPGHDQILIDEEFLNLLGTRVGDVQVPYPHLARASRSPPFLIASAEHNSRLGNFKTRFGKEIDHIALGEETEVRFIK
jgi:hypothetical protein